MQSLISDRLRQVAKYVSAAGHPMLMPAYMVAVWLYGNTLLMKVTGEAKLYLLAVVIVATLLIPLAAALMLRLFRFTNDFSSASNRRMLPVLLVLILGYISCIVVLRSFFFAVVLNIFLKAALACLVVAFVVNMFWRMSYYMVGLGGLLGCFVLMTVSGVAHIMPQIVGFTLLAGAVASSRLYLGKHNIAQIACGFAVGLITSCLSVIWITY